MEPWRYCGAPAVKCTTACAFSPCPVKLACGAHGAQRAPRGPGPGPAIIPWVCMPLLRLFFLIRHVQYLPEYVPSAAEKADPDLYAANVRDAMAQGTGLVVDDRGRDPRGCGPWDDSPMESPCPTFLPFLSVLCLCLSASHRTVHAHRFVFVRFLQPRVCV